MKQFFKFLFASFIGSLISMLIILFIVMGIVGAALSFKNKPVTTVQNQSVLQLKLNYPVGERTLSNPLSGFNFNSVPNAGAGLDDIIKSIEKAKSDEKIQGILISSGNVLAGVAATEAIRKALIDFRESEKFVYAYADGYSQKAYYLASVCDKVFLHPMGSVDFKGLNAQMMFYKDLLDLVGVDVQVIRHGKFKSAVEPYLLDKMSEANREQVTTYLGSLWSEITSQISESRGVEVARLNQIADSLLGSNGKGAMASKLVDELMYKDQFTSYLKEKTGLSDSQDLRLVSPKKYLTYARSVEKPKTEKERIAIVYAVGEIKQGKGSDEIIGSDRISAAIREARKDENVKAIVLRVNSPGGDALASDIIGREIVLAKKEKPVIISMGDVAASGGYWISAHGSYIFAEPTTITGSIGVFGMIPNFKGLVTDKLGVNVQDVSTNKNSDFISVFKPMPTYQRDVMQGQIETIYDDFLTWVSEGRNMTKAQVDSIGQGRVWSGINAKKIGLVDEFGGLNEAVAYAAKQAKIENYRRKILPEPIDPFQELFNQYFGETKIVEKTLGKQAKYYQYLKSVSEMEGVQARIPYVLEIN
ncbi:MAG: signal peptide peptidase SppA [Bacteroidales bacterium]